MQVGPEISVASTKAFTAPLVDLLLLSVFLAEQKKVIDIKKWRNIIRQICAVPELVGNCLERESGILEIAIKYNQKMIKYLKKLLKLYLF